jgi:hypothetical protein
MAERIDQQGEDGRDLAAAGVVKVIAQEGSAPVGKHLEALRSLGKSVTIEVRNAA